MYLVEIGKNWYLQERVKRGKVWRNENIISYGKEKPTFYKPLLIQGDAKEIVKRVKKCAVFTWRKKVLLFDTTLPKRRGD